MDTKDIIQELHKIMDAYDLHTVDEYQYPIISRSIIEAISKTNDNPILIDITNENYWTLFKVYSRALIKPEHRINNHPILLIFNS